MTSTFQQRPLRAAEFFAGIGLFRSALERAGVDVVFANDLDPTKSVLYRRNFPSDHLSIRDIALVHASDIPDVDVATASFPCTDLSLAGKRAGLGGAQSSTFWEFARILDELENRRPRAILLENVGGLGSSRGGEDLRAAIQRLNVLGYICDILMVDARWWVPQSRPRVFVVGSFERLADANDWRTSLIRPMWVRRFRERYPDLELQAFELRPPTGSDASLADVVERLGEDDARWWDEQRSQRFLDELSGMQSARLESLRQSGVTTWRTAYRRTRHGTPAWEMRRDEISGCLRTARGGSSKQAVVEIARSAVRVRWMTPREYARLMGAPDYKLDVVTPNQALFGMGDAVCVPAAAWLISNYVRPLASESFRRTQELLPV